MIHASLFSGIGGPEVAAAMMGWDNAFHCEINPFGRAVLDYWFPESDSYDDITKTSFKAWRGKVDVLTGGFPCQPFSYAGKRNGRNDDRYLWPEMLRAIDEIRPTWVVGENVVGITNMVEGGVCIPLGCDAALFTEGDDIHRYEFEESFTIERICEDFERIGYSVQPVLVPAAAVGAPHRRDRIFIIAYNDADAVRDGRKELGISRIHGGGYTLTGNNAEREIKDASSDAECTGLEFGMDGRAEEEMLGTQGGRGEDGISVEVQRPEATCIRRKTSDIVRDGMLPGERWKDFPSVPAVHRGNDGIPIRLDNLSISFRKWRTESLKAYGNAIVPQVMYRIFQAIEAAEQETNS